MDEVVTINLIRTFCIVLFQIFMWLCVRASIKRWWKNRQIIKRNKVNFIDRLPMGPVLPPPPRPRSLSCDSLLPTYPDINNLPQLLTSSAIDYLDGRPIEQLKQQKAIATGNVIKKKRKIIIRKGDKNEIHPKEKINCSSNKDNG